MSKIISIHSFRGGTGKSNAIANVATLLASEGLRVGVVDADVQSPGIHILFGLTGQDIEYSLNDYLWGRETIETAAYDVTANIGENLSGHVYLIPSSIKAGEIARVLRGGYDVSLLTRGFRKLIKALNLDILMIDTHPGLNEETLFSMAISHTLVILMRPDQQDYEGTGVTVEVARSLEVPNMLLVVNKTPPSLDPVAVNSKVEQAYNCQVAAILPHADEMMDLASGGVFSLRHPNHPLSDAYKQIATQLMA